MSLYLLSSSTPSLNIFNDYRISILSSENVKEPLLRSSTSHEDSYDLEPNSAYPPSRPTLHAPRPRSKSKPESIFIHPNESNIARADAAAAQLGLAGDTERVRAGVYPADEDPWEHGRGRDVARELLLGDAHK